MNLLALERKESDDIQLAALSVQKKLRNTESSFVIPEESNKILDGSGEASFSSLQIKKTTVGKYTVCFTFFFCKIVNIRRNHQFSMQLYLEAPPKNRYSRRQAGF